MRKPKWIVYLCKRVNAQSMGHKFESRDQAQDMAEQLMKLLHRQYPSGCTQVWEYDEPRDQYVMVAEYSKYGVERIVLG